MKKIVFAVAVLFGLMGSAVSSRAALTTIGTWGTAPINDGTATWRLISTSLPADLAISFYTSVSAGTGFSIQGAGGSGLGTALKSTYSLIYEVVLNNSALQFNAVFVDSTIGFSDGRNDGASLVQKTVRTLGESPVILATGSSVNGNPGGLVTFTMPANGLHITESIYADPDGKIFVSDFQNSYTVVPEPTTVLAGSLLLLPFAASTFKVIRRRKQ